MGEIGCRRRSQNVKSGFCRKNCEFVTACQKQLESFKRHLDPSLKDLVLKPKSNKISRPPNAFMIYAREHRKLLASKFPKENNKNISSMLGESWKKIDPNLKVQYFEKAKMLEELHKQQYPGYVYSPRVARMQKMQRNKKRTVPKYCVRTNQNGEKELQPNKLKKNYIDCDDKDDEWVDLDLEAKISDPGYVPNNPQYFAESEAMSKACEKNISQMESENRGFSGFPPPPWHAMQNSTMVNPYMERRHDEFEIQPGMHTGHPYHRQIPPRTCNCEVCDEYRDQCTKPSTNPFLSNPNTGCQCASDCNSTYVNSRQTPEQDNFTALSPPRFHEFKSPRPMTSFEHPAAKASFQNSLPYTYGQYKDYKSFYYPFSRPPMPWTPPPFDPPSYYYQDMNYLCNRNQDYFKSYYGYPYPTPSDYIYYPSSFDRTLVKQEVADSNVIAHSNESSNQDYEVNEHPSSDTEILNPDDIDIDEDNNVLSPKPESKVFEPTHIVEGEKTLQSI